MMKRKLTEWITKAANKMETQAGLFILLAVCLSFVAAFLFLIN